MAKKADNNITTLLERLSKIGVCRTGRRYLNMTDKDFHVLVKVWRRWPEYLYEHAELVCPILRAYLTEDDKARLAKEYLYLDYKGVVNLEKTQEHIFLLGNSDIRFITPEYGVHTIFLFNNSLATVDISTRAYCTVETYNYSFLRVVNGERGKCTCFKYDESEVHGACKDIPKDYVRGDVFNGKEPKGEKITLADVQ